MKPRAVAALVAFVGISVALGLAFQPYRRARQTYTCQSNLKQIGLAFLMYNRDYDEKTLQSARWNEVLWPYLRGFSQPKTDAEIKKLIDCPLDGTGYALNRFYANGLSDAKIKSPSTSVAIFDSSLQTSNASDFGASFPRAGAHFVQFDKVRGNNVLFADAHVELLARKPLFRSFVSSTKETR